MYIEVKEDIKAILIWLTNEEQISPIVNQFIDMICTQFQNSKMRVAIFNSGQGDLTYLTKSLLSDNKNIQ